MNRPDEMSEELVSAYLDGEVTADEQARVESLLADSPAHRRLYDELRELRDHLQALPEWKAPDRLLAGVLRDLEHSQAELELPQAELERPQAELEHLQAEEAAGAALPAIELPMNGAGYGRIGPPHDTRRPPRRRLIYAAGAVAAAALLAVVLFSRGNQKAADRPGAPRDAVASADSNNGGGHDGADGSSSTTVDAVAATVNSPNRSQPPTAEPTKVDPPGDVVSVNPPVDRAAADRSMANSLRRDDPLSLPPPAAPPRNSAAVDPAAPSQPMESRIVYLFELTLTSRGVENDVFRQALEAAAAPYETALEVDAQSKQVVSSSRKFGRIGESDQLLCVPLTREQKEIVFNFLNGRTADVLRPQHDLPEVSSNTPLFDKIKQMEQGDPNAGGPDKLIPFLFVLKQSR